MQKNALTQDPRTKTLKAEIRNLGTYQGVYNEYALRSELANLDNIYIQWDVFVGKKKISRLSHQMQPGGTAMIMKNIVTFCNWILTSLNYFVVKIKLISICNI